MNEFKDASVVLLSPSPGDPVLELLYSMWLQSRNEYPVQSPRRIQAVLRAPLRITYRDRPELFIDDPGDLDFREYYDKQIELILSINVPLLEALVFTFVIQDMSISFREQLVRHRDAAYWLQSGRIRDVGSFFDNNQFRVPPSIRDNEEELKEWRTTMSIIQDRFNGHVNRGMRIEDAREVLPSGQLHRGSVTMNFRDLKRLLVARTSFIAKADLWHPVLQSLSSAIRTIDPRLTRLFEPPSIKNGRYIGDTNELENRRRLLGDDPLPPDPIFMKYEGKRVFDELNHTAHPEEEARWRNVEEMMVEYRGPDAMEDYIEYASGYAELWGEEIFLEHCWYGDKIINRWKAKKLLPVPA